MSFRKRSVPLSSNLPSRSGSTPSSSGIEQSSTPGSGRVRSLPGVRPSSQFPYVSTTSTGTPSLDELLGLGAGLALGSILAVEENGSTDYSGVLLSCFASQGILHGQEVFVAAPTGSWPLRGSLPGQVKESRQKAVKSELGSEKTPPAQGVQGDRMKIAWRYERLGVIGTENQKGGVPNDEQTPFSHQLDLTTSLPNPKLTFLPPSSKTSFPDLDSLNSHLTANPNTVTRLVLPSLLSPLYYPAASSTEPGPPLRFLASLRHLVHQFPTLVVMLSWPLALFPHFNALTQGMERFVHGVISLEVFPHGFSTYDEDMSSTDSTSDTDRDKMEMQGLIRVTKLPILSDRGMGLSKAADGGDWAFAMGRRKMVVRPFNLPPLGDMNETTEAGPAKKDPLEF